MTDIERRLEELQAQEAALRSRKKDLYRKVQKAGGLDAAAVALLEGKPEADVKALLAEYEAATTEYTKVRRARELAEQRYFQARDVQRQAEQEAAIAAARERQKVLVRGIAEAVCTLGKLLREEADLREPFQTVKSCDHGEYLSTVAPLPNMGMGSAAPLNSRRTYAVDVAASLSPTNRESALCNYVRRAVTDGYLAGDGPFLEGVNWR